MFKGYFVRSLLTALTVSACVVGCAAEDADHADDPGAAGDGDEPTGEVAEALSRPCGLSKGTVKWYWHNCVNHQQLIWVNRFGPNTYVCTEAGQTRSLGVGIYPGTGVSSDRCH